MAARKMHILLSKTQNSFDHSYSNITDVKYEIVEEPYEDEQAFSRVLPDTILDFR